MTDYVRHMADHYDNIKYLGPQPREQVLRSMRQAKALIFPSQWYEGFPMVLVEAMAMGLPAIASRLGSMTNIVQHGKTGLLFPTSNSDALNESVGILDNNPQLLEAMRHNAREAYLANYTADVVMPQLVALYEEVIDTFSQGVGAHRHGA
jgi:glycosyltransferase involved in cell wall biosynthesis